MQNYCARFLTVTGHFFLTAVLLSGLVVTTSCTSEEIEHTSKLIHNCGSTVMVVSFSNSSSSSLMPEAVFDLPKTSSGRFHFMDNASVDYVSDFLRTADLAGKLLFLIIPETEEFSGARDHLVITVNSTGIPVSVQPELGSEFLADSLWEDPLIRQSTIMELSILFKPDIVYQYVPENSAENEILITEYWQHNASDMDISVALFSYTPNSNNNSDFQRNGWGVFTGTGFTSTILNGLSIQNFLATVKLIAGMNWSYASNGYPAIQALENAEIK